MSKLFLDWHSKTKSRRRKGQHPQNGGGGGGKKYRLPYQPVHHRTLRIPLNKLQVKKQRSQRQDKVMFEL